MPKKRNDNGPYWTALRAAERKIIWDALALTAGDIKAASRLLDVHRNFLRRRINALEIDVTLVREGEGAPLPTEPVTTTKPASSWLTGT